jgi:plastocyanin
MRRPEASVDRVRPSLRSWTLLRGLGMLVLTACALPGLDPLPARGDPPSGSSTVILTVGPGPTPTEAQGPQTKDVGQQGPIQAAAAVAVTPLAAEAPPPPPPPPPPPAPTVAPAALEAATANAATAIARATNVAATATALPAQLVVIRGMAFEPPTLAVSPGTAVTFRNLDSTTHQIVTGEMDSGRLQPGESWTTKFQDAASSHTFVCRLHPTMKMAITISDPLNRTPVVRMSS